MSQSKTDPKKRREKLYKKIRNTSTWGSAIAYLLLIFLFTVVLGFMAVYVLEYIYEMKVTEAYSEAEHTARLYESGKDDQSIMKYIDSSSADFYVTDKSGKIIYSNGKNTSTDDGGEVLISNGKKMYMIYRDSQIDFMSYDGDGEFKFKITKFIEWYSSYEGTAKLPIWVSIDINGGTYKYVGKTFLTFTTLDTVLVIEIASAMAIIVFVIFVITIIKIIKSAVNHRRVIKLFYSDPVTNGHNWTWYVRYGEERLQSGFSKKEIFAVVNLVFRNYRKYCLCHSISEGEELLARINKVLSGEMKKHEMCAYATISNFALLLRYDDEMLLKSRLYELISKLQAMDSEHTFDFQIGADVVLPQTNSIGKIVRRKNISIENLYNNACTARAALAEAHGSGIRIFDKQLLEDQKWEDTVYEKQQSALDNEEFVVYYQPKYDPCTDTLRGAEALIRWQSPEFGLLTPYRFIPIFEKNGFITEIDHYMISHVAKDQRKWLDMGMKCVPVSVNVSRVHFAEPDLADQIRDLVDKEGVPHDLIEIELTESAFFDDKEAMLETIGKLKEYGFDVSMDDFGSGYSSLNSLKDMPLDVLKLDAEFFRGDNADERGRIVVSEAIKLARSLNMRTVAEGVEVKEQVDFLAQQQCDMIQGYYYAKPMPAEEFEGRMQMPQTAQETQTPQNDQTQQNEE